MRTGYTLCCGVMLMILAGADLQMYTTRPIQAESSPDDHWARSIGRKDWFSVIFSCIETRDGGYVLAGRTKPYHELKDGYDALCIKIDKQAKVLWAKTFGKDKEDAAYAVRETKDGGLFLVGRANSSGGDASDIWCARLDRRGNIVWQKSYGSSHVESGYGYDAVPTEDGGFLVLGATSFGNWDTCCLKLKSSGAIEWQKTYRRTSDDLFWGNGDDICYSVKTTPDGGYFLVGYTDTGSSSYFIWALKLDHIGNVTWERTYNLDRASIASAGCPTADGGYVLVGQMVPSSLVNYQTGVACLKLDSNGDLAWKTVWFYEGLTLALGTSIEQTNEGGYIVTGTTFERPPYSNYFAQAIVAKLDSVGRLGWSRIIGKIQSGSGAEYTDEVLNCVVRTKDNHFLLAGVSAESGDWPDANALVLRTSPNGTISACQSFVRSRTGKLFDDHYVDDDPLGSFVAAKGDMKIRNTSFKSVGIKPASRDLCAATGVQWPLGISRQTRPAPSAVYILRNVLVPAIFPIRHR